MALMDLQGMQPPTPHGKPPKRSGASKQCEGGGGALSTISLACNVDLL